MTRRAGGLELTPLGERTLPLATEIERAVRSVRDLAEERRARVRIATPSGMTRLFVRVVKRMRQQFPTLALEISTGARYVDLDRGEADLAVRLGPVTDERLVVRKLADMGWALYAAPSYLAGKPPLRSQGTRTSSPASARRRRARAPRGAVPRAPVDRRSPRETAELCCASAGAGLAGEKP